MSEEINLKDWDPSKGKTGVTLYVEFEPNLGSRGRLSSLLHGLPVHVQSRINLDGSRMHADLSDIYELLHDPRLVPFKPIKCLDQTLRDLYPEVFGPVDKEVLESCRDYMGDFRILENFVEGDEVTPGFHHYASTEALVLEPEDWTWEQWKTLCTLCGMKPEDTARMVLNLDSLEVYNEPGVVMTDSKPEEGWG